MMTRSKFLMERSLTILLIALGTAVAGVGCASNVNNESSAAATPTAAPETVDASSRSLTERTWSLMALDGAQVTVPAERARPSLMFDAKTNRASGMAGVNRFSGPYTVGAGTIKLGPLMATKMAGPPELNELETRFLRALERATTWRTNRGELELLSSEQVLARFAPR
jgi:heat shock protein HslJ